MLSIFHPSNPELGKAAILAICLSRDWKLKKVHNPFVLKIAYMQGLERLKPPNAEI